jgi:hypothetical protein
MTLQKVSGVTSENEMMIKFNSEKIFDSDDVWWRNTWNERQTAIKNYFGETEPPGIVTTFNWTDPLLTIPGACVFSFPRKNHSAYQYIHVTLGQTQPESPNEKAQKYEFALYSPTNVQWEKQLLYDLITDFSEKNEQVEAGTWYPLSFFQDPNQEIACGLVTHPRNPRLGNITGLYLWPDNTIPFFKTSIGDFELMNVIGITSDEDDLAIQSSPPHLLLLIKLLGLEMMVDPLRKSVLSKPDWHIVWKEIKNLDHISVLERLRNM